MHWTGDCNNDYEKAVLLEAKVALREPTGRRQWDGIGEISGYHKVTSTVLIRVVLPIGDQEIKLTRNRE